MAQWRTCARAWEAARVPRPSRTCGWPSSCRCSRACGRTVGSWAGTPGISRCLPHAKWGLRRFLEWEELAVMAESWLWDVEKVGGTMPHATYLLVTFELGDWLFEMKSQAVWMTSCDGGRMRESLARWRERGWTVAKSERVEQREIVPSRRGVVRRLVEHKVGVRIDYRYKPGGAQSPRWSGCCGAGSWPLEVAGWGRCPAPRCCGRCCCGVGGPPCHHRCCPVLLRASAAPASNTLPGSSTQQIQLEVVTYQSNGRCMTYLEDND